MGTKILPTEETPRSTGSQEPVEQMAPLKERDRVRLMPRCPCEHDGRPQCGTPDDDGGTTKPSIGQEHG